MRYKESGAFGEKNAEYKRTHMNGNRESHGTTYISGMHGWILRTEQPMTAPFAERRNDAQSQAGRGWCDDAAYLRTVGLASVISQCRPGCWIKLTVQSLSSLCRTQFTTLPVFSLEIIALTLSSGGVFALHCMATWKIVLTGTKFEYALMTSSNANNKVFCESYSESHITVV